MAHSLETLPPLDTLRAFEAAARAGSFSAAAATLHLTHGAISRRIARLEGWLGLRVFERQARGIALTPEGQTVMPAEEFLRQWTVEDIDEMVYDNSSTDMLCAMPLPLTDLFRDGLSPWEECAELASRRPDRTVFWGSVNPLEGRRALDLM